MHQSSGIRRFICSVLFFAGILGTFSLTGCRHDLYGLYPGGDTVLETNGGTGGLTGVVTKSTIIESVQVTRAEVKAAALQGKIVKGAEVWIEELPNFMLSPKATAKVGGSAR